MATFQAASGAAQRKRLSIGEAIKGSRGLPSRVVFYGPPGIGKTCFATCAPDPFFILSPGETGLQTLMDARLVPELPNIEVGDLAGVLDLIEELSATDHPYKSLVFDTINGLEKLANAQVCKDDFGGDWSEKGFIGFGRGHRVVASTVWLDLLARLDRLREAKKMRVILLAHVTTSNVNNPNGPDYTQYRPAFDGKETWERTCEWADMVLFATADVVVDKSRGDARAKALGGTERTLWTEQRAGWVAKNRHNLPARIAMGDNGKTAWAHFVQALRTGRETAAAAATK